MKNSKVTDKKKIKEVMMPFQKYWKLIVVSLIFLLISGCGEKNLSTTAYF